MVQLNSGKGLVTSSGSTPGLVARTSADPKTLRKVTSESVDTSRVEASVPGHCVSGTMPKASKAAAASRSRSSRLNLAIAVAKVSVDRNLFASPCGEAELAINPVASMESVVHEVSLKYWSAIRQSDERRNEDVPVLWRYDNKMTLADQRWPVVSTDETSAGTSKSCQTVDATPTQIDDCYR